MQRGGRGQVMDGLCGFGLGECMPTTGGAYAGDRTFLLAASNSQAICRRAPRSLSSSSRTLRRKAPDTAGRHEVDLEVANARRLTSRRSGGGEQVVLSSIQGRSEAREMADRTEKSAQACRPD